VLLTAWARFPGQVDQEQSDNQTQQSDGEPGPAAGHEAAFDEAGTLTNPDPTDQYRDPPMIMATVRATFDDMLLADRYRVTRNSRSSSPDGSPLPSVLELLNSRLFPSCATTTVRSRP
jgi:hypothetical protein